MVTVTNVLKIIIHEKNPSLTILYFIGSLVSAASGHPGFMSVGQYCGAGGHFLCDLVFLHYKTAWRRSVVSADNKTYY